MIRQYFQKNSENQRAEGQIDEVMICEHRQYRGHRAGRDTLMRAGEGDERLDIWFFRLFG